MQFSLPSSSAAIANVRMKPAAVLAVLTAVTVVVHADFDIYLSNNTMEKYLSVIDYPGRSHYVVAAKKSPDMFCKFKLVTSGMREGRIAIHTGGGSQYICRVQEGSSPVDGRNYIRPDKPTIEPNCLFEYKLKIHPDIICGARIALKADNDRYWIVSPQDGVNYIKPVSMSPVYFDMINLSAK